MSLMFSASMHTQWIGTHPNKINKIRLDCLLKGL